jgi:hypothetical protein
MSPWIRITDLSRYDYELDLNVYLPSYGVQLQRDFVWTNMQQQELIKSILKGNDCGHIVIVMHEHKIMQVIDGKQRINAVISFINGLFALYIDGMEYKFDDLDEEAQREVTGWTPLAEIAYSYESAPISDDDKIALFNRVNFAGTPQDAEHMQNLADLTIMTKINKS